MHRVPHLIALLVTVVAWTAPALPARADVAPVPLGPTQILPVPPEETGHTSPAVALRPDGGFVTVWGSLRSDRIVGRWSGPPDLIGTPESGVFTLSEDAVPGTGYQVAVARSSEGGFLAVWTVDFQEPALFARAFDDRGRPLSEVLSLGSSTMGSAAPMDLAARPGGGFVLAWWQGPSESARLRLRFLGPRGTPLGSSAVVDLPDGASRASTRLSASPDGGFALSWSWRRHAEGTALVQALAFSSAGEPIGPAVNVVPEGPSEGWIEHDLAAVGPGEYLAAWSDRSGPEAHGLLVRRFDATGTMGPPHRMDLGDGPDDPIRHPALAATSDGQAVAAWSQGRWGDVRVLARLVDAEGEPRSDVFPVHPGLDVGDFLNDLDAARDAEGHLVFAWGLGRETDVLPTGFDSYLSSQTRRFLEPDPACAPVLALDFRADPALPDSRDPVQLGLGALTDCADLSLIGWSRDGARFRIGLEADPQACAGLTPPNLVTLHVPVGALHDGEYAVEVDTILPDGGTCSRDFAFSVEPGETPPPPEAPPLTSGELSGFRTWVKITAGPGDSVLGAKETPCIPETLCVSGQVPGRSEVFVRIVGPKPNGRLWPTLVKFSTSQVEVWIEQVATGEVRYFHLDGASPGVDELPGLFDRDGFEP